MVVAVSQRHLAELNHHLAELHLQTDFWLTSAVFWLRGYLTPNR